MLIAPLYSSSADDKSIIDFFSLNQHMGLKPKLSTYIEVDLQSMLSPSQKEFVKRMRPNAQPPT